MKNNWLKSLLPHAIAVLALLILATLYCKPVLDGKILSQSERIPGLQTTTIYHELEK